MKLILISTMFWFTLTMYISAESAGEMYQIVALKTGVKEALKANDTWKACGEYFAAAESTTGKIN